MSTFSELIDFTRSSTGTYLDSVVYGDELVTNGTFDTDSDWDKQNGWSITNGEAVYATGTGREILQISIPTVAGKTYKVEFDITSRVAGAVGAYSLESVQNSATYKSTVGPYERFLTATGSVMALRIRTSTVSANLSIDNVSLVEVTSTAGGTPLLRTAGTNEPRLEYDASGQPLGLLIEEQRSNILSYSEAFDNAYWGKVGIATSPSGPVPPDGSGNAVDLLAIGTSGAYVARSNLGSAGQGYTASVFAKAGTHDIIRISNQSSGTSGGWFDLTNGTTLSSNGANNVSRIEYVGNGWYRCSRYFDSWINTNNSLLFGVSLLDGSTQSATGDTVSLWGAQLELGAFPTSYIPTSGSTVTRNSDVCSLPLERYHHNAQSYTMYAEFQSSPKVPSNFERVWALSNDASPTNYVQLQFNTVNKMQVYSVYNDAANMTGNIGNIEIADTTNKIALKVDGTSLSLACNGILRSGALTNEIENFEKLHIGIANSEAFGWINTHIKVIRSYAKGYTNAQLIELTKPSSSPTISLTFDGQATSELVEGLHD